MKGREETECLIQPRWLILWAARSRIATLDVVKQYKVVWGGEKNPYSKRVHVDKDQKAGLYGDPGWLKFAVLVKGVEVG